MQHEGSFHLRELKLFNTLKALKASNNEIIYICKTIQNLYVLSNSLSSNLNNSSMYDLCVIGGDQLVASLLLKACSLPMLDGLELPNNEKLYPCTQLLEFYFGSYLPVLGEKALLNGNDLIRIFNILPSRLILAFTGSPGLPLKGSLSIFLSLTLTPFTRRN